MASDEFSLLFCVLTALYILLKFKLVSLASPPLDPLPPNLPECGLRERGQV